MNVGEASRLLATGTINAYDYYNFYKKRTQETALSGISLSCIGVKSDRNTTLSLVDVDRRLNKQDSVGSSLKSNWRSACQQETSESSCMYVNSNAELRLEQSKKPVRKGLPSGRQSKHGQFSARIKPSDMRYCSDKKRETLVNKIIQEEKIKQIRRSLVNFELYRGYREGFNSSDEKTIEEEIEQTLPAIQQCCSTASSDNEHHKRISTGRPGSRRYRKHEDAMSASTTGSSRGSGCGNWLARSSSLISSTCSDNSSIRSDHTSSLSSFELPMPPHKLFTLKLSMIEEDTSKISKSLSKTRDDVESLMKRFNMATDELLTCEENIENVYRTLGTFVKSVQDIEISNISLISTN